MSDASLPPGWKQVPLKVFAEIRGGASFPVEYQGDNEGEYPFYKVSDMNLPGNETRMSRANNWVSKETVRKLRAHPFPRNTVIFPKVGAAVHTNKKRILTMDSLVDNNVLGLAIQDQSYCSPEYLLYWFTSFDLGVLAKPGPLPAITAQAVKDLTIPLPPLPEQRAIAHILRTVQAAREARQREVALERERKAALMAHLFTYGTRGEPTKQTPIGEIPESWEVADFGQAVAITQGQVNPLNEPYRSMVHVGPENIESGTGRLVNLRTNADLGVISGNYLFTPEDVLYSKIRPYLNKVALPDFEGTCSADMYPLRPSKGELTRSFLFHYLLSRQFVAQAIAFQDRTGIPKINRMQLGSVLLIKPPPAEQEAIADLLSACDAKITSLEHESTLLDELFRALLEELMTGRLSVAGMEHGDG